MTCDPFARRASMIRKMKGSTRVFYQTQQWHPNQVPAIPSSGNKFHRAAFRYACLYFAQIPAPLPAGQEMQSPGHHSNLQQCIPGIIPPGNPSVKAVVPFLKLQLPRCVPGLVRQTEFAESCCHYLDRTELNGCHCQTEPVQQWKKKIHKTLFERIIISYQSIYP